MTRRLLALPVLFAAGVTWGWFSPYAAAFAYGLRCWHSALKPSPCNEADLIG